LQLCAVQIVVFGVVLVLFNKSTAEWVTPDLNEISFFILEDGSYMVKFKQDEVCSVDITIKYKDEKGDFIQIRGNPFSCGFVEKNQNNSKNNDLYGT
jgi:hypothetical protein